MFDFLNLLLFLFSYIMLSVYMVNIDGFFGFDL